MLRNFLALTLAALSVESLAQGELLTLDEATRIALENNLAVTNAYLDTAAAKDEVAALEKRRLPRVELRGRIAQNLSDHEYTFEEGVWGDYPLIGPVPDRDIEIDTTSGTTGLASAGVVQPLSQLYRLGLTIEQGDVKIEMAEEQERRVQQDINRLVKQQYFDIVQTQNELQVADESVVFYESLETLVQNYVQQEVALEYELAEVQARLARRKLEQTQRSNRLATQKERMNNLLARDIDTPFFVANLPDKRLPAANIEDAVSLAMASRPDVAEAQMKVRDAQLAYDIKKSEYLPDIDLRVQYTQLFDYTLIPEKDAYVGVAASWEIFDWGRKRKELASKSSLINKAENGVISKANQVEIEVRESFRSAGAAEQSVRVASMAEQAQQEKLRVTMNRYRQQSALLQDVLEAETELDRARNEYSRAVMSVWKAQAALDHAMGQI